MTDPVRLFVFGLGYSATAFARAVTGQGGSVTGTSRDPAHVAALADQGISAIAFDGTGSAGGIAEALGAATHLLVSVPPAEEGDPVLLHHSAEILASRSLRWIGYLSTVGVYGNYGGAWVTERTTPHASSGRSLRRLAAERAWTALAQEGRVPLAIFRLAGIYGPGRNAFVNLAEGKAKRIVKPGQVFNRIHVADIVGALSLGLERNAAGLFNLADDEPAPPQDVVTHAAGLMGVAPPPEVAFEVADLTPMARSFYGENKRVSNRRIKRELGLALRYPTYRDGLDGALA